MKAPCGEDSVSQSRAGDVASLQGTHTNLVCCRSLFQTAPFRRGTGCKSCPAAFPAASASTSLWMQSLKLGSLNRCSAGSLHGDFVIHNYRQWKSYLVRQLMAAEALQKLRFGVLQGTNLNYPRDAHGYTTGKVEKEAACPRTWTWSVPGAGAELQPGSPDPSASG